MSRLEFGVNGVHKKCSEPEAVGNFHHGSAQSLRRPALFVRGVQSLRRQPETVGKFIMGGCSEPETSRNFREWNTQKVLRA